VLLTAVGLVVVEIKIIAEAPAIAARLHLSAKVAETAPAFLTSAMRPVTVPPDKSEADY
jgi:hypothetical protein